MMKILIGAPVKQDEKIFKYYLESLSNLKCEYQVDWFFILHNSPELKKYLKPNQYEEYINNTQYKKDDTHHWGLNNFRDVVNMKNYLLQKALREDYDYFFLVDSDLILHEKTLLHLLLQNKPLISEIFWTKWDNESNEAMPNAWQYDKYDYSHNFEWRRWKEKALWKVGYSGACILIRRDVIESGVDYTPIHNVSFSIWEDRSFCIRAAVHGYQVLLDTTYPALHLYREKDVENYEANRQM